MNDEFIEEVDFDSESLEEENKSIETPRLEMVGMSLTVEFEFLKDLMDKYRGDDNINFPLYIVLNGTYFEAGRVSISLDFILKIKSIDSLKEYKLNLVTEDGVVDLLCSGKDYIDDDILSAVIKL